MKGKIIFVNSFKGGAGKTTFSLTYCVSALFDALPKTEPETKPETAPETGKYKNVIYMDLDILGTGACYLFSDKYTKAENSFDHTGTAVKIPLALGSENANLYTAFLDPGLKNSASYGEPHFINHQNIAEEKLKGMVLSFIKQSFIDEPETLLVLDCGPGFSEFEQQILMDCYKKEKEGIWEVQEDYITTLDNAHIRKCAKCLGDSRVSFRKRAKTRNINVTINDIQNYNEWLDNNSKDPDQVWEKIAKEMQELLGELKVKLWKWKYSEYFAMNSVILSAEKVENNPGEYLFSGSKYERLN